MQNYCICFPLSTRMIILDHSEQLSNGRGSPAGRVRGSTFARKLTESAYDRRCAWVIARSAGRVAGRRCHHLAPSEPRVRLSPHAAQAAQTPFSQDTALIRSNPGCGPGSGNSDGTSSLLFHPQLERLPLPSEALSGFPPQSHFLAQAFRPCGPFSIFRPFCTGVRPNAPAMLTEVHLR